MADSMEKLDLRNELIASFKTLKSKGVQIVSLINAAKSQYATDRAAIAASTALTQDEKDTWDANYVTKIGEIKAAIQAVLPA